MAKLPPGDFAPPPALVAGSAQFTSNGHYLVYEKLFNSFTITGLVLISIFAAVYSLLRYCEQFRSADWGGPWINRLAGLLAWFVYRYHRMHYDPIPLPAAGGAIVVSNHISGLDPLLLIAASARPLRFLIAREEYERFGLRWIFRLSGCIPVERDKRPELAMRLALRALKDGEVVALFPHGKIHLQTDPPVKIKGGAVRLAQKTGCPLFPVHISGVRGKGHTLLAIPLRSRVQLTNRPTLICQPHHSAQNIHKLQTLIESPADLDQ